MSPSTTAPELSTTVMLGRNVSPWLIVQIADGVAWL